MIVNFATQVIAYTILDINRTTRLNEQPMTPEQQRQLQQMAKDFQGRSGICYVPFIAC